MEYTSVFCGIDGVLQFIWLYTCTLNVYQIPTCDKFFVCSRMLLIPLHWSCCTRTVWDACSERIFFLFFKYFKSYIDIQTIPRRLWLENTIIICHLLVTSCNGTSLECFVHNRIGQVVATFTSNTNVRWILKSGWKRLGLNTKITIVPEWMVLHSALAGR